MHAYAEEFQRFRGGHYYLITFDSSGKILKATIDDSELRRELDVTTFISSDEYWRGRVDERLSEIRSAAVENKYFKSFKDEAG